MGGHLTGNPLSRLGGFLYRISISLKLAVLVMVSITGAMIVATFLESLYDTPTAQYWVYQTWWFYTLMALLGVNIFMVAISRYPWKLRHGPFLLAHVGILMLLAGSWMTYKHGLDGSLRINEGEVGSVVETSALRVMLQEIPRESADPSKVRIKEVPLRWTPPNAKFSPLMIGEYGLTISDMMGRADRLVEFLPAAPEQFADKTIQPAVQVSLFGGPMALNETLWLWGGDFEWSERQMGPLSLAIGKRPAEPGNSIRIVFEPNGNTLNYWSRNADGKIISAPVKLETAIVTGSQSGVQVRVLKYLPKATPKVSYEPAKIQYGSKAPPAAIRVVAGKGGPDSEMWLGLGDRAILQTAGKEVSVTFLPERAVLPFGIELERFEIEHYDGTRDPSRFSSIVRVVDAGKRSDPIHITMNEPLTYKGLTFYQASYEAAEPRPTITILSVNQDPGRWLKYIGSLLIVLGSIWLFLVKYGIGRGKAAAPKSEDT